MVASSRSMDTHQRLRFKLQLLRSTNFHCCVVRNDCNCLVRRIDVTARSTMAATARRKCLLLLHGGNVCSLLRGAHGDEEGERDGGGDGLTAIDPRKPSELGGTADALLKKWSGSWS